jgi:hypothetical protein
MCLRVISISPETDKLIGEEKTYSTGWTLLRRLVGTLPATLGITLPVILPLTLAALNCAAC